MVGTRNILVEAVPREEGIVKSDKALTATVVIIREFTYLSRMNDHPSVQQLREVRVRLLRTLPRKVLLLTVFPPMLVL